MIDCATRKVIGWVVDDNYRMQLITSAIQMAACNVDLPGDAKPVLSGKREAAQVPAHGMSCRRGP